jgi:hypothetical protein
MARKERFPTEPDTVPKTPRAKTAARQSGPAPKSARERSEAPTLPPPPSERPPHAERQRRPTARRIETPRASNIRTKKPAMPAARVDEVTADLSRDPRTEKEDE